MSNLRIIYNNIADKASSVTASTTAGSLTVANLKTDIKGQVHRSTGTNVTYTLQWTTSQDISAVVIPACNLTETATIRVQAWDAVSAGVLLLDTGTNLACPGLNVTSSDFSTSINASLFGFGAASKAYSWFNLTSGVKLLQIDIVDTGNPAGYIDCARLIVGNYWSPSHNASFGASISLEDSSTVVRTDAGGISVNRAPFLETMTFEFNWLLESDRKELDRITKLSGSFKPILISLLPDWNDASVIQSSTIYGVRKLSPFSILPSVWQNSITIESW